jgi:alanyl-tRNA synthetase
MTSTELRASFLAYFARQGHRIVPSSPLVPHGDTTLLFTNAGMNQFKDVFLGREPRSYTRATTSQKCMRVSGKHNDLDNVGPSLRHHTFFEMLGNFSFGDYFKREAIAFAWELLTAEWALPIDRLHATIFAGDAAIPRDDEAHTRWSDFLPGERIHELGADDNFWSMGDTGPCGRCSEIHYFRGDDLPCPAPVCLGPACDCDRFVEVWNNVFMEFDRQVDGTLLPLPKPSIDTGMGLERIAAIKRNTLSNYDTDVFASLLEAISNEVGPQTVHGLSDVSTAQAGPATEADAERRVKPDLHELATAMSPAAISSRVVADHVRAMTFLIGDGVLPSNEWRGYVLRKIMRRAMRHGKRLGATAPFLHRLVDVLVAQMGDAYPELRKERDTIVRVIRAEEERFDAVLTTGLPRLEELLDRSAASDSVVSGEEAFRLYDTFGLPLDFIEDLVSERKLVLDRPTFDRAMEGQRDKARAKSAFDRKAEDFVFSSADLPETLRQLGDRFEGYSATEVQGARVVALFDDQKRQVKELSTGTSGYAALDRTPFYAESGGQVSDVGILRSEDDIVVAKVDGMLRTGAGLPRTHRIQVLAGPLTEGQTIDAVVDNATRDATRRNHTATHLLHATLRQVLGTHVKQAGSLVAPDRLRFDFTHFAALAPAELESIERIVNEQIYRNTEVTTDVRNTEEAMAAGAMALFGEKYGERVRVVSIPGFSVELCGGTHTRATGDIGFFTITDESGVAAGVRRVEAQTGAGALRDHQARRATLRTLLTTLNANEDQAGDAITKLQADSRRLAREVQELKVRAALGGSSTSEGIDAVDVGGVRTVFRSVPGLDKAALRELADSLKSKLKSGVVVLASASDDGRVAMVVSVTPDLKGRVHAGNIVKALAPIVGGGGGGRPDFAEAGGKDPSKIDQMLNEGRVMLAQMLQP